MTIDEEITRARIRLMINAAASIALYLLCNCTRVWWMDKQLFLAFEEVEGRGRQTVSALKDGEKATAIATALPRQIITNRNVTIKKAWSVVAASSCFFVRFATNGSQSNRSNLFILLLLLGEIFPIDDIPSH